MRGMRCGGYDAGDAIRGMRVKQWLFRGLWSGVGRICVRVGWGGACALCEGVDTAILRCLRAIAQVAIHVVLCLVQLTTEHFPVLKLDRHRVALSIV